MKNRVVQSHFRNQFIRALKGEIGALYHQYAMTGDQTGVFERFDGSFGLDETNGVDKCNRIYDGFILSLEDFLRYEQWHKVQKWIKRALPNHFLLVTCMEQRGLMAEVILDAAEGVRKSKSNDRNLRKF